MADSGKTGQREFWSAVVIALLVILLFCLFRMFVLVPWAVLAFGIFELFFRRNRCGAPTNQARPCRLNARGRWRACRYDSHRRIKRAVLWRALRGGAPVPLHRGRGGRGEALPGEGAPLDDPFLSSSWGVRTVAAVLLLSLLVSVLTLLWADPVVPA